MASSGPPGTRSLKRHAALIPLSRDHHFALMQALSLIRSHGASTAARREVAEAFLAYYEEELVGHMADEEAALVPAASSILGEEAGRLLAEHEDLRARSAELQRSLSDDALLQEQLPALGQRLHDHVRFEERVFFERVQERLTAEALEDLGRAIEAHREARGRRPGCAMVPPNLKPAR